MTEPVRDLRRDTPIRPAAGRDATLHGADLVARTVLRVRLRQLLADQGFAQAVAAAMVRGAPPPGRARHR